MDKELLRVVIIATGLMVMVGMLLWSYLKNKKASEDMDFFDDQEFMGEINESLVVHTDNDDFDVVPVKSSRHEVDDGSDQLLEDYDEIELEEEIANRRHALSHRLSSSSASLQKRMKASTDLICRMLFK